MRPDNAICPYCLSLTTLEAGQAITCGLCESEFMRAMNFFIPLDDYLRDHSIAELTQRLYAAKIQLKQARTKTERFYHKDYVVGLKRVIKLKNLST